MKPEIVYRDRPVVIETIEFLPAPVDQSLLREYDPVDGSSFQTNGDLLRGFIEANSRIRQCSADKRQLRGLLDGT